MAVDVIYGTNEESLNTLENKTVREALEIIGNLFSLPSNPDFYVNDEQEDSIYVLEDGDVLEIIRAAGQKGY